MYQRFLFEIAVFEKLLFILSLLTMREITFSQAFTGKGKNVSEYNFEKQARVSGSSRRNCSCSGRGSCARGG